MNTCGENSRRIVSVSPSSHYRTCESQRWVWFGIWTESLRGDGPVACLHCSPSWHCMLSFLVSGDPARSKISATRLSESESFTLWRHLSMFQLIGACLSYIGHDNSSYNQWASYVSHELVMHWLWYIFLCSLVPLLTTWSEVVTLRLQEIESVLILW